MIPATIIARKRDGHELTDGQIRDFIAGFTDQRIPDYQMSALAMAIFIQGMTTEETASLTRAMLDSGSVLTWPEQPPKVDKHSTGGVGDKISLPLAPLLAGCGMHVPMLSGRGLGATGGTLDKLESIAGFRTDLSLKEMKALTSQVGCVITGASSELAPADRRLYALRDVTATVPSIPLITASIMSKKLAEGLNALVLDVKFGSGAFMKTREQATQLARSLVATGQRMGVRTTALLTDMNQPLGRMCGNAVEVQESLDILDGGGPSDVRTLTLELATELLISANIESEQAAALQTASRCLDSGRAMEKFHEMVIAQKGQLSPFEIAESDMVQAASSGCVNQIDTEQIGLAVIEMGGGRRVMTDSIDHSVGLKMLVRLGDTVEVGQPLAELYSHSPTAAKAHLHKAIQIGPQTDPPELIVDRITADDEVPHS